MYCSASQIFVENNVKSFKQINRVLFWGISNRIYSSEYEVLIAYVNYGIEACQAFKIVE